MNKPIDQIKNELLKFIHGHYRQLKEKLSPEDWNEYQTFYWNVRRYLPANTIVDGVSLVRVYDDEKESVTQPDLISHE